MKENKKIIFDTAYNQFLTEKDAHLHYQAVKRLLLECELEDSFVDFLEKRDSVKDFFLMWEQAGREEKDPKEKEGLKMLGEESKKLYLEKNYKKLVDVFFNITLRHLSSFIHLDSRKDFEQITDHDLYIKDLIPGEIFLQFFLIETMIKRDDFKWDREDTINNQNLACLAACFVDINSFFNEE